MRTPARALCLSQFQAPSAADYSASKRTRKWKAAKRPGKQGPFNVPDHNLGVYAFFAAAKVRAINVSKCASALHATAKAFVSIMDAGLPARNASPCVYRLQLRRPRRHRPMLSLCTTVCQLQCSIRLVMPCMLELSLLSSEALWWWW